MDDAIRFRPEVGTNYDLANRRFTMQARNVIGSILSKKNASIVTVVAATAVIIGSSRPITLVGQNGNSESTIQRGLAISPVPLNLVGKNRALVAEGSYIVNTSGCNDCHTNPNFTADHDPQLGQTKQINAAVFLAGGRAFGPRLSRNLTPNSAGLPAGLTFADFVDSMRNGVDK